MRNRPWDGGGSPEQITETDDLTASLPAAADDPEQACRRCGRPLRSELARAAGYGAVCAMKSHAGLPYRQPALDVEAVGR